MAAGQHFMSTYQPYPAYPQATDQQQGTPSAQPPAMLNDPFTGQGSGHISNSSIPSNNTQSFAMSTQASAPIGASFGASRPCKSCEKQFPNEEKLRRHVKNVHEKSHICPKCRKATGAAQDLHRHLWKHHRQYAMDNNIPKTEAKCPKCGTTQRSDNMKRHMESCFACT